MASTKFLSNLVIDGSGGTVLDVQGSVGQLFSVTDSLTGDLFAVSDISGIPILNVNSSGAVDIDGTLNLGDSDKIQLGASQDLQIYHNGNDSYIQDSGTGDLRIISSATKIYDADSSHFQATFTDGGSVDLYYGGNKKLETTSTGVTVTGNIGATNFSGSSSGTNTGDQDLSGYSTASGVEDNADVTDTANVVAALTAGTNVSIAANGTISATDTNYYLNAIERTDSTNTLVFGVSGATNQSFTFGANAFNSTTIPAAEQYTAHEDTSTLSGTYGSTANGTKIDQITVDSNGHITNISTGATGNMTGFFVEDGDGTEVQINNANEWKFVEGTGININWTDTDQGIDSDPYDLTFSLKDNSVSATQLNVSGNGTSGQVLTSDGDGTFSWSAKTANTDTITSVGISGSETSGTVTLTGAGATSITQSGGAIEIRSTNTQYSDATTSTAGLMSTTDKSKLDGIASGAEVNVQSDWNATTGDAFINNKPTLGTASASAATDFVAVSGDTMTGELKLDSNFKWATTNAASYTYSNADSGGLYIETVGNTDALSDMRFQARASGSGNYSSIAIKPSNQSIVLRTNGTNALVLDTSQNATLAGKLYIGTTSATTTAVTALFLGAAGEVKKRGLGSNAFSSTSFLPLAGGTVTGMTIFEDGMRIGTGNHNTDGRASITFGEGTTTTDSMYIEYDGENLSGDNNAIIFGSEKEGVGDIFRVTYGGSVLVGSNAVATESYVGTAISNLVDSAPATLDTLNELAAALGDDASFSTTVSTALGNRLRIDVNNQSLSSTELANARTNLGLGTAATSASTAFISSGGDDSFSGNLTSSSGKYIKFYHSNETDANDGKIGSGVFASGLNIVGTQTTAGTGRQVRIWGDLINSAGASYLTAETFSSSDVVLSLSGTDVTAGESITLAGGLSYSGTTLTSANDNTTYTAGTGLTLTNTTFSVTANTYATAAQGTTADAALPKAGGAMTGDIDMASGGGITFYGNGNGNHGIYGKDASGTASDDIRINSYHNVHINLDSNSNNTTSTTFFTIGQHGGEGNLGSVFTVDGAGNVVASGDIKIDSALLSNQENTDVDTGTETVATVAHATYTAAFFDYVIKNGTNVRAGTVYSCHDGTNVEFTETSTVDLGDTSDVTLAVDISGTDMRLRATTTSNDWSVKSLVRAI